MRISILPRGHHTGWRPPLQGQVQFNSILEHPTVRDTPIKSFTDLSGKMPTIWDQGQEGSCTAHGTLRAYMALLIKLGLSQFMPSRQAQYNWTRIAEQSFPNDSGCSVMDAFQNLELKGVAYESDFPYGPQYLSTVPPTDLKTHGKVIDGYSVDCSDISQFEAALSGDLCIVLGATIFEEFEDATRQNPVIAMPSSKLWGLISEKPMGGHCFVITGHDQAKRLFQIDNSWGTDWGLNGRAFLPYEYIPAYCSDAHVIDSANED